MGDYSLDVVAVVDAGPKTVTVWHIDISNVQTGLGRLCGAWVVDSDDTRTVELVTRTRLVLATKSGQAALKRASAKPVGRLDVAATLKSIRAERDRLQHIYEQQPGKTLVPPRWPDIPGALDMEAPPLAPDVRAEVAVALGVARWLERMARSWEEIESQRLRRSYMVDDGDSAMRPCPVTVAG